MKRKPIEVVLSVRCRSVNEFYTIQSLFLHSGFRWGFGRGNDHRIHSISNTYKDVSKIQFEDMDFRNDIGKDLLYGKQ